MLSSKLRKSNCAFGKMGEKKKQKQKQAVCQRLNPKKRNEHIKRCSEPSGELFIQLFPYQFDKINNWVVLS